MYHWFNNDSGLSLGICPVCGNRCSFSNLKSGYYKHCSVSCSDSDIVDINKKRTTKYKRYGDPNFNNRDKAKGTCNRKYGKDNPGQVEVFKEKSRKTKTDKHGYEYYTNREKSAKTVNGKYNVNNISQLEFVKRKKIEKSLDKYGCEYVLQSPEVRRKGKLTSIGRFGVDNYSKSKERSERDNKRFYELYNEYMETGIVSKHGVSKVEIEFYKYLVSKFGKDGISYDYMSDQYPFRCDFYIKSLDLYIELNSHWTHGGHPFNESDSNDLKKLELWKSKNNRFYNESIKTWTVRDVRKRSVAEANGLNYIEVFETSMEKIIADFERKLSSFIVS